MSDIAINPVTRRVQFTGNTGTGPYAFTFNVLQSSDIVVYKNNVLLTETTDYTVSIAANGTGNITMVVALVLTDILTIIGGRELSRTTDFVTAGDLLASSLNEQLDSNVIMSQQLDERFGRTLNVPPGDEDKTLALPLAADRADKVLTFDTEGNVQAQTASDLFGGAVLGGNFVVNTGTGDGSTVAFGLTGSPGVKTNIQIYIDGVYQDKASFSLSGQTVTFTEAPPLNAGIEFIFGEAVTQITGDASAITYNQGGTGAQERTVKTKLQETVSVKDFGAVGDGVADDTAAIQAALDSGARRIYIPTGYYKISTTLTVPATVSLISGDGINASRLWSNTSAGDYILDTNLASVSLRDFRIYGGDQETSALSAPTTRNGIKATGTGNQFAWENIAIYGFNVGASVGATASTVYMCLFKKLIVGLCNTGIFVDQGMHQSSWINCQFQSCVNYGMNFNPTGADFEIVSNGIYNCTFERTSSGTGAGLSLENVRGLEVSACYFEANKTRSIYLTGTSTNGAQAVSIHNCYFFDYSGFYSPAAGGHGIEVVGPYVDGVSINNNHFEDYDSGGGTFYPIRLVGYSGETTAIHNNVFNNCTLEIQSDFAYQLNDRGGINDHVIARKQARSDGSGDVATTTLAEVALGNASAQLFLQVTMVRCTDDVSTVDASTVIRMKAAVSTSTVTLTVGSGSPTGVTFSVGSTTAIGSSFVAPLQVTISGGDADTNIGFIVETAYTNNAKLGGLSTIPETLS